ncbi:MAG TPA: aminoacetone oxidase family FAD-binding enzyme [bacterium]|nr:aminoacetone oxidase family FAD-binding enzyme [bacterium]
MVAPRRRVAVVGAGAAGIMAAIHAATAGAEVLLIERTPDGGRKLLLSGGGRCNLLPAQLDVSRFRTASSPNTLRKIIRTWPLPQQIAFFQDEVGIKLTVEPATGKMFPVSGRAREVRDKLFTLARRRGVRLLPHTAVSTLTRDAGDWRLTTATGTVTADAVVVATGGLSFPDTGSDGGFWPLLAQLGHSVVPAYPALTPLLTDAPLFTALADVALDATVTAMAGSDRATATGGLLFTHQGFSGPAILEVSHIITRARLAGQLARITVNWTRLTAGDWRTRLHQSSARPLLALLRETMPERLAAALCSFCSLSPDQPVPQLRREERARLIAALTDCVLPVTGDAGYVAAEVTGGGIALADITPATMASRHCPQLHLAGELLDVFGMIGGNNLLWAWTTGRLAGLAAAR